MTNGKIIYSRGFPYGAPLALVRGGATKAPEVKQFLKDEGFRWDSAHYAWITYLHHDEFQLILRRLRDDFGCDVMPKSNIDPGYVIDLDRVEI